MRLTTWVQNIREFLHSMKHYSIVKYLCAFRVIKLHVMRVRLYGNKAT